MSARASSTVKAITRWTCAHKPLSPWMSFSQMEIEQELSLELVQWVLKNSSKRQPAMSLSASPPGCSCKPESSLVTHRLSAELSPSLQQPHVSICIRNSVSSSLFVFDTFFCQGWAWASGPPSSGSLKGEREPNRFYEAHGKGRLSQS